MRVSKWWSSGCSRMRKSPVALCASYFAVSRMVVERTGCRKSVVASFGGKPQTSLSRIERARGEKCPMVANGLERSRFRCSAASFFLFTLFFRLPRRVSALKPSGVFIITGLGQLAIATTSAAQLSLDSSIINSFCARPIAVSDTVGFTVGTFTFIDIQPDP